MSPRVTSALLGVALLSAIVVPFTIWGDDFEAYGATLVRNAPPTAWLAATLVGLMAGDLVLPVPSSLLAVGAGAVFGVVAGSILVALGLSIGAWIGYELGRSAGRAGVRRWVDDARRQRLEGFARRHGLGLLVAMRAVPVLAEASVIVAGSSGMPRGPVLLATTLANLAIAVVYAAAGSFAAETGQLEVAAMAGVGIPGLAMLIASRRRPVSDHEPPNETNAQ